jgi:hypothetical protein
MMPRSRSGAGARSVWMLRPLQCGQRTGIEFSHTAMNACKDPPLRNGVQRHDAAGTAARHSCLRPDNFGRRFDPATFCPPLPFAIAQQKSLERLSVGQPGCAQVPFPRWGDGSPRASWGAPSPCAAAKR